MSAYSFWETHLLVVVRNYFTTWLAAVYQSLFVNRTIHLSSATLLLWRQWPLLWWLLFIPALWNALPSREITLWEMLKFLATSYLSPFSKISNNMAMCKIIWMMSTKHTQSYPSIDFLCSNFTFNHNRQHMPNLLKPINATIWPKCEKNQKFAMHNVSYCFLHLC